MEELLYKMMLQLKTMDTRLQVMETKLDAVDTRLEAMDTRLEAVETKLESMDTKIDRIQHTMNSQHIENIESDSRLLKEIHSMNDRLDFQRNKITKTEEDLYLLKQK